MAALLPHHHECGVQCAWYAFYGRNGRSMSLKDHRRCYWASFVVMKVHNTRYDMVFLLRTNRSGGSLKRLHVAPGLLSLHALLGPQNERMIWKMESFTPSRNFLFSTYFKYTWLQCSSFAQSSYAYWIEVIFGSCVIFMISALVLLIRLSVP